jgi:uncharacterized protein
MGAEKVRTTQEILRPPTESEVQDALVRFAVDVRRHYGDRVVGFFLFGSRARGDHHPFSDADIAIVLKDENWQQVREIRRLARLAHDVLIETGVEVQGWPVSESAWSQPERHPEPALVQCMRRDAKPIETGREHVLG